MTKTNTYLKFVWKISNDPQGMIITTIDIGNSSYKGGYRVLKVWS